mmetsp:Transcript_31478/g.82233  ORF Transcript_31478/g.82233 Transcript_31478/m.82233 type:complete len:324 (+) Transcript_31478:197-1168(+)
MLTAASESDSPVAKDLGISAALIIRILEVPHVQPVVRRKLLARADSDRLVLGAKVALVRIAVKNRRPEQRSAAFWLDADVELWKVRLAAFGRVVEVHEECVHPRAPSGCRRRVLVMVHLVELPSLVLEYLQVLRVALGHECEVGNPPSHGSKHRIIAAVSVVTPGRRGGANGLDAVACLRAHPTAAADTDDALRLLVTQKGIETHNPRITRVNYRSEVRVQRVDGSVEHVLERPCLRGGLHVRRPSAARGCIHRAPFACPAALVKHALRLFTADATSRLRGTVRAIEVVAILALAEVAGHRAVDPHIRWIGICSRMHENASAS